MRWNFRWGMGAALALSATAWSDDVRPHAGMLRFPDISAESITFVYANDLWLVPRTGGVAAPLASPPGAERFPRFSPDGKTIAFIGNYDGNSDIYTVPVDGGIPTRVTYHPTTELLYDWAPENRLVYFANGTFEYPRAAELFSVPAAGGLPEKLPVPYGANGAVSPDGQWLAYTPHAYDFRTWKRYRGGMATDIWLFNLESRQSKKITDWEGSDSLPMWQGRKVYYVSDQGSEHRLNIWVYDPDSGQRKQVTRFADFDVKWPSNGPGPQGQGEIVFQLGSDLMALDLATEQSRRVEVIIPGDRPTLRARTVDAGNHLAAMRISSTGKRACIEARGDIWTVPARKGSARNLTATSGVAERDPAWSPDGKLLAYFADEGGEYALYVRPADGSGAARQVSTEGDGYFYSPTWSPDSKHIYYCDKAGNMYVHTLDGATRKIDTEPWANQPQVSWSHDSNWLAYTVGDANYQSVVVLYDLKNSARHVVTSAMFNNTQATFDREGKYVYLASNREFSAPIYEDVGGTFVYANTDRLYVVPLRNDIVSPFAPKSDEEGDDEKDDDKDKDKDEDDKDKDKGDADDEQSDGDAKDEADPDAGESDAAKGGGSDAAASSSAATSSQAASSAADEPSKDGKPVEPLKIDLEGFERRMIPLPVARGAFTSLAVNDENKLLYVRQPNRGEPDGQPQIRIFDVAADEPEEKGVCQAGGFMLSSDGKKMLVFRGRESAIVDARPDQKLDKPLVLRDLSVDVDPRAEWAQILREAWRVQRDFFYDPTMHGVDWRAIYFEQYSKMLADAVTREDLSYIIAEMISELNVGHAYYSGGDTENAPSRSVGMLGCDYRLENGAYRIVKIYEGGPWDADARGPLSQPGVDVKVNDYLLAVNGRPVDPRFAPWAAFQGLADKIVTLTVSEKPTLDDSARQVVVQLPGDESNLRYRAWIEKNRKYVEEKSGGRVGYVYVPDTGVNGQNNLFRQFYGQRDRQAMIIDERWNGGGQIPDRFIELLNRPVRNYWARRDGNDWSWPSDSHQGPKCMLINGLAGSGGDCFPYYFRQSQLGPIIGTRTWGGLVGISGNPGLIDGGYTTAPTFAFYETDGTWGVEGHGVDPDVPVLDDPALMQNGRDIQLDKAIELMLAEIERTGYRPPSRPAYPNRKGMGLPESDR